jgi:hypothetical protein
MGMKYAAVVSGVLLGAFAAQAQLFNIDFDNLRPELGNNALDGPQVTPWKPLPYANPAFITGAEGRAAWGANESARVRIHPGNGDALSFEIKNLVLFAVAAWEIRFEVVQNFIPTSLSYDTREIATSTGADFRVAEAWTAEINGNPVGQWATFIHTDLGNWEKAVLPLSGNTVLKVGDKVILKTLVLQSGGENGNREVMWDNVALSGVVPEPSTYAMFFGLGLAGFAAYRRLR